MIAKDGDNGLQWSLKYSIVGDGNVENYFKCDPDTGVITTNDTLDRETVSQFVMTVMVCTSKHLKFARYYNLLVPIHS